jgi:uncharacterized protein YjiS (DUF1127 family)
MQQESIMQATELVLTQHRLTPAWHIAASVRRLWVAYWDRRARQATVQILRSLDHRTLKDIGLDPAEIESTIYGKPGERLQLYREDWTVRSGS